MPPHARPGQHFNRQPHNTGPRWATIYPGQVIWIEHMLQTLAASHSLVETGQVTKPRPVVALKKMQVRVDAQNICLDDAYMPGVSSTSQDYLVEARPYVPCLLHPHAQKTSHFWPDTLTSVPLRGERMDVAYQMTPAEKAELADALGEVLQPEKQFFLKRLFNRESGCLPGQVWTIELPCTEADVAQAQENGHAVRRDAEGRAVTREADAMVLLKRGAFIDDYDGHEVFTPFTVAVLPGRFNAADLRGLAWNRIRLMPLHERSFLYPIGQLTRETVSLMVNTLRREVSLQAINYQQPDVTHLFHWLSPLRAMTLRGF